jgi:catechol 2,3-dioxygenase-like lactoylglutathione lyase family enzyme
LPPAICRCGKGWGRLGAPAANWSAYAVLDHVTFAVGDLAKARAFYDKALAPVGICALVAGDGFAGYGDTRPFFWMGAGAALSGRLHVAFAAKDRAGVVAFHTAALAAGGTDNGAPGLRPHYDADYYGAFVLDPEGHNIEAVCRAPA